MEERAPNQIPTVIPALLSSDRNTLLRISKRGFKMGDFEKAVDDIRNKIAKTMTDDELKEVYGLYKQATVGDINIEKPSVTDPKVRFP